ncbi:MAG: DNA polymerase I, partial [Clostridium sp.]|nr:DNA polymerase I [Clostridium sp.]
MERLLILDSNSLLNRAFYAIPELTTTDGIHTNAVYGFANMLFKMKEELKPDYVVAAFDRKGPTFRHKEYKDYKAGRKKMPEELAEQFPLTKDLLNLLSITIYEMDGYEADDIIGSLAKYAEKNGIEVYIVTGDRDALQLASDNINVVITKKGVTETAVYNYKTFMDEFGVTPTQFIDVKGLMGDKSDNIPGVPGVGEKTAYKLIQTYGSIEEVLNNIDNISGKKLKENLENNRELAIFSKKLATIITEAPMEFDLDEIKNQDNYNYDELKKFFFKLQMKSMIDKLPNSEENEKIKEKEENFELESITEIKEFSELHLNLEEICYITYEVSNSEKYSEISLDKLYISSKDRTYYIDFKEISLSNNEEAINGLKKIMEKENLKKVIHNGKSLITILNKLNIEMKNFIFDTAIAAYLVNSARSSYDLLTLINEYLCEDVKGEDIILQGKLNCKLEDIYHYFKKKIEEEDMEELYYKVEHPLIYVLSSMESIGFKINEEMLDELAAKFKEEIITTEKEIFDLAEEEFNINSPKQLGKILFEK